MLLMIEMNDSHRQKNKLPNTNHIKRYFFYSQQISSSNLLAHAQDEDLLVTEFSIIGHTSSSSGSTAAGIATSASAFESRASTGSGSTEAGMFACFNLLCCYFKSRCSEYILWL